MTHPALADATAVDTFDAGPCVCPGTPHERDTITHLADVGFDDIVGIARASTRNHVTTDKDGKPTLMAYQDPFLEQIALIEHMVVGWSFVDAEGQPVPFDPKRLREAIAEPLAQKLDAIYQAARRPVPNAPSGPSPAASPDSPRPNRATRRSRTKAGARPSN